MDAIQPDPSRRRRGRVVRAVGLATVVVVVAALAAVAALALIRQVAESRLRSSLQARGIDLTRCTIADLSPVRARLVGVSLDHGAITVDEVIVWYTVKDLLAGRLDRVDLRRPRLDLDRRRAEAGGTSDPGGTSAPTDLSALSAIGLVTIEDGRVGFTTALGAVEIEVEGSLRAARGGAMDVSLRVGWSGDGGRFAGDIEADIEGRAGPGAGVTGTIHIAEGRLAAWGGELTGVVAEGDFAWTRGLPDRLDLRLTSGGELDLAGLCLTVDSASLGIDRDRGSLHALLRDREGLATVALDVRADGLPDRPNVVVAGSGDLAFPRGGRACLELTGHHSAAAGASAALDADLDGIRVEDRATGVSGRLQVSGGLIGDRLTVALAPGSRLRGRIDPAWPRRIGMPEAVAAALGLGRAVAVEGAARAEVTLASPLAVTDLVLRDVAVSATTPGEGGDPVTLSLSGAAAGPPSALAGQFLVAARGLAVDRSDLDLAGLAIAAPVSVALQPGRARLALFGPGELLLASLSVPDRLALAAPLRVELDAGFIEIARATGGGVAIDHGLDFRVHDVALRLGSAADPVDARGSLGAVSLKGKVGPGTGHDASLRIDRASLVLPDLLLALDEVSADLHAPVVDGAEWIRFAGRIRHGDDPPLFVPVRLEGVVRKRADELLLDGQLRLPGIERAFTVSGFHRQGDGAGAGEIQIESGTLDLAPGGLQPADLSPRLGAIRAARGRAQLSAALAWGEGSDPGAARIIVDDLSFELADLTFTGVAMDLELDTLAPSSSAPGQCFSARRIVASIGPPLENLHARFTLDRDEAARVHLEQADASFVGGRISAGGTVLDASGGPRSLVLAVDGLDLGEILRWVSVEGLSGEGRFDGVVPLAVLGEDVVVAGGRLAARGPGVLRYRSARAREVLGGHGQTVDLMVEALEDFHYSELGVTLSQAEGGETRLGASLLGANPAVLDAYPFRINLDLTGNSSSVLAALRQSYRLRERIFRRGRE